MGRELRISLVSETWPPEINGVAMTLSHLAGQLARRGHRLQLVRPLQPQEGGHDPAIMQTLRVRGMAIPGYPELRLGLPAGRLLRRAWRLQRPDVIYVATEGPLGWSAVRQAARLGIPVVSGFHTQFHHYSRYYRVGWLQPLVYRYLQSLHNRTACTLVPTETMRRQMSANIPAVEVLSRGIDTELFHPAKRSETLRREWGVGPADKVFLYVGRLAREKNIELALETFLTLRQGSPTARLVLVGHGPDYARLYARHEGIIFAGSHVGEKLACHYASADIFLFPSMSETFGNVVLEAMASGLGVVAFDEAAAGIHISHGNNGMLCPVGDGSVFLRHSKTLLANPPYLQTLRKQARRAMEGVSWERVGAEFERILRSQVENLEVRDESSERMAADFSR
ncbi:MAG: glycosyltransferase family 1 protein [Gammaproteobacteria bacterium]|nr:glycosyltransferase family 1 protein [Gammaproteobacteria bacterium]MCW8840252.1 glycosyltransferase family 1 protein [Gammaproteobacteria bacterium]MCW8959822.1 glycosyltransferase family 1 protein [Gammaproteobacteria bacterium]MCW8971883.1 glycosyltransferase family 1 protein [Gammaproteobacteria bacterium]MCW8994013.1 glycosyltransferase family 1 protein [Gammaproteobacteria bacterium]